MPAYRRRIGVVFQDFRLIRHLSAFDNVALPLRIAGRSEEEVEGPVREMLAWVGLADRASARPPTLSGGEQQRVAIARAVIARPELVIADEPTGNVDAAMAERILHLLTAMNRLGTTVIVATHDVGLIAATPGAQLIRLEKGALVDPTGALKHPPGPARPGPVAMKPAVRHRRRAAADPVERRARAGAGADRDHDLRHGGGRARPAWRWPIPPSVVKAGVEHRYSIQIADGAAKAPGGAGRRPGRSRASPGVEQVPPERPAADARALARAGRAGGRPAAAGDHRRRPCARRRSGGDWRGDRAGRARAPASSPIAPASSRCSRRCAA